MVEWGKGDDTTNGVFFDHKFQPLLDANKKPLRGEFLPKGNYLCNFANGTRLHYVKDTAARLVEFGKDVKIENVFHSANVTYAAGTKGNSPVLFSLADGKAKSVKLPRKIVEAPPVGRHVFWCSFDDFAIATVGNGDGIVDNTFQMTSEGIKELNLPSGKKICNFGSALYPSNGHCAVLLCNSADSHLDTGVKRYVGTLNSKGEITLVSTEPLKNSTFMAHADGIYCFVESSDDRRRGAIDSCLYCSWPAN